MLMDDFTGAHRHCDDYIDDSSQPECLRTYLDFNRMPAYDKMKKQSVKGFKEPRLFADHNGERVRVVMASRFGDVGITTKLNADFSYQKRVFLDALSNFSTTKMV